MQVCAVESKVGLLQDTKPQRVRAKFSRLGHENLAQHQKCRARKAVPRLSFKFNLRSNLPFKRPELERAVPPEAVLHSLQPCRE